MRKINLGKTGINVSPLGFGTLTLGPFQLDMPVRRGADLIKTAVESGINIIDTAKAYQTYSHIKKAMDILNPENKKDLHIISRSYDYTYEGMEESFCEALEAMGIDRISIFMLHEMESEFTLKGHAPALKCLGDLKKKGKLTASGISTHYIAAVRAAAYDDNVDIIFAILNREGLGIMDGTRQEMEDALLDAHRRGKGILIMKALGGGHFFRQAQESLLYAKNLPFAHSVIIGMQSREELEYNISVFSGEDGNRTVGKIENKRRKIFIEPWCRGCGKCVESCPFKALSVVDGKARVNTTRCMICSYCAGHCPDFCIKTL